MIRALYRTPEGTMRTDLTPADFPAALKDPGGAMDTYLSVINNRMNDIMKTITVITTLFMPLSFLTGFFGMNLFTPVAQPLDRWTTPAAFGLTLAVMIGTPIGMIFWLRKRGWM
jgi:magnesium transporter